MPIGVRIRKPCESSAIPRRFHNNESGNWTLTSPRGVNVGEDTCRTSVGSGTGSDSSRTVGEIAWLMFLRVAEIEDDILFIILDVRLPFFSGFSSFVDDESDIRAGVVSSCSRLEDERCPFRDIELLLCVDGGRVLEGEIGGDLPKLISRFIDLRFSDSDVRPSLMKSLMTFIDDLRS